MHLDRVTKIRNELESSSSATTRTGLDNDSAKLGPASAMRMMETLASKQDSAFERLYHFLHSKLDLSHTSSSVANVPTSSSAARVSQSNTIGGQQETMDEALLHPFIKRSIIILRQVPAYYIGIHWNS